MKISISFNLSIKKKMIAVLCASMAFGGFLFTQPIGETAPEKNQLKEISGAIAQISNGRNRGVIFKFPVDNLQPDSVREWFVPSADFNDGNQALTILNHFEKINQQLPIAIYFYEKNHVKKIWGVKFGSIEVMSYARARQNFETDAHLSRIFRYASLALLVFILMSIINVKLIK